jgi:hypothetical protein
VEIGEQLGQLAVPLVHQDMAAFKVRQQFM